MFRIEFSDGTAETFDTTQECLDRAEVRYPDYYAGHDGDLSEGGDRTLVWATEAESVNDDGAMAVAVIRRSR